MMYHSIMSALVAASLPALSVAQWPGGGGWGENGDNFPTCANQCAPSWDGNTCNGNTGNWGACLCQNQDTINSINSCVDNSACSQDDKNTMFSTLNQLCLVAGVTLTNSQESTFGSSVTGAFTSYTTTGNTKSSTSTRTITKTSNGTPTTITTTATFANGGGFGGINGPFGGNFGGWGSTGAWTTDQWTSWWNGQNGNNNGCPSSTWTGWTSGTWSNQPPWTSWSSCTGTTTATRIITSTRTFTTTSNGQTIMTTSPTTSTSFGIRVAENTQALATQSSAGEKNAVPARGPLLAALLVTMLLL